MRTNFQMITDLSAMYTPKQRGVVSREEIEMITESLCLEEMDELQLRNMRDFVVMFYSRRMDETKDISIELEIMDKMSAITAVIDSKIYA